jgi:hypothetical protein
MIAVHEYQATDGTRFKSEEACRKYEAICGLVAGIMGNLKPRPDYMPHGSWIQQSPNVCRGTKRSLIDIARTLWDAETYPVLAHDADEIHPMSGLGRIIDDGGPRYLQRAWQRMICIDWNTYREYEQPFFALNPEKAAGECA